MLHHVTNHALHLTKSHVIFWCPINHICDAILKWLHKHRTVPSSPKCNTVEAFKKDTTGKIELIFLKRVAAKINIPQKLLSS